MSTFGKTIVVILSLWMIASVRGFSGDTHVRFRDKAFVGAGPNFRIYPSNVTQTETFITRHPSNPTILFASANTINLGTGFTSEGIYVSTNAGSNWFGSDTCNGSPIGFHRGDPGIAIDKNGTFLLVRLGFSPGLYSHYSTDAGRNWSAQKTVVTNDQDRASLISDGNPASTFYGRSYAVWVRFAPPFPVWFSYTDDGGRNWSSAAQVNNPVRRGQGGEVSLGPNGAVHVCWAGVIDTSPFTEDFVGFASSTDGGTSWTVLENAFDMNGIAGTFPDKSNIRVNGLPRIDTDRSGGARNGWIYIVTTQKNAAPAGTDPDIVLNRSTDGGRTWSSGIRVNQDPLNNGKFQYFPALHVDDVGGLNIIYYDDRNTARDSTGVFFSRSIDGGDSWNEFQISDHHFKPLPIGGLGQGYQGDNIGVTSLGPMLWPVWMDNSTGIYQIWTSPIQLAPVAVPVGNEPVPDLYVLKQNYPNPFNPSTTIEYELPLADVVTLKVVGIDGREIATLSRDVHAPGNYTVTFNSADHNLSSGIYLYQLTGSTFSETKRMVLLK